MYIRKGRRRAISIGQPFPKEPERLLPAYKNIVQDAMKVKAYLGTSPELSYTHASLEFNLTRVRISQLMKIVDTLPPDFIEQLKTCNDSKILKRFSGKQLLKIASLSDRHRISQTIKSLQG